MKKELVFNETIQVTQPKMPELNKYVSYLEQIWDRKWLTNNGPIHEKFKAALKEYLHVPNAELFTNGHLALEIALRALELKGEVITTPFTFASTTHAIVNRGLKPVFCDIDPHTYNIDADKIENYITVQTCAIVAVHVFGTPCDVKKIEEIAQKYNLKVIYDAAHAFGVKVDGKDIGNFGDVSMFSLHATKVFNSIEGGLLTYQDESLSSKFNALKNFGLAADGSVQYVGTNAKMNEFQAAMGLCNLENIDSDISHRELLNETYIKYLQNVKDVQCLLVDSSIRRNYSYFPIVLKDEKQRDNLYEKLRKYNVISRKYFYPLCNSFECYDFNPNETPIALDISQRILCLPMYSELKVEQVKQISEIIALELGDTN
jgi:dTDP-4-amino-4,6-dideoxygalactose transaminase